MQLILQRHTTPEIATGVCYGRTDLGLANSFENEFRDVIDQLPHFEHIITSPLRRCRLLAEAISSEFGLQLEIDQRLIEFDFGSWECVPWNDIPRAELDQWAEDFRTARPHGGENVEALEQRLKEMLEAWAGSIHQNQVILVVTHAGVIRTLMSLIKKMPSEQVNVGFGEHIQLQTHYGI